MTETRTLQYNGILYPRYEIDSDGNLWLKFKNHRRLVKRDDIGRFNVRNPYTGKMQWITAHRAALESFHGYKGKDFQACHKHGTKPNDCKADSCEWGSAKKNREDRRRDGTSSTGNNTKPGKLKDYAWDIILWYQDGGSVREIANYYRCTRQAINRWLKYYGYK